MSQGCDVLEELVAEMHTGGPSTHKVGREPECHR
jgi:hypothetical protein